VRKNYVWNGALENSVSIEHLQNIGYNDKTINILLYIFVNLTIGISKLNSIHTTPMESAFITSFFLDITMSGTFTLAGDSSMKLTGAFPGCCYTVEEVLSGNNLNCT
jgi:hypothetical protein